MAKDKKQQPKPSDVLSMPARPMRAAQEPIAEKLESGPPESLPEIPTLSAIDSEDSADSSELLPVTIPMASEDSADSSELLPVTIPMAYAEPKQFVGPVSIKINLHGADAKTFQRIHEGLNNAHAKLKNGNHVDKHTDVIRYIIENLADAR